MNDRDLKNLTPEGVQQMFDQLQAENESLKRHAEMLTTITENVLDPVALTDLDGNFIYAGKFQEILGYDAASLIGKNVLEFIYPEDRPHALEAFKNPIASGETNMGEYRCRRKDGDCLSVEMVGKIVSANNGGPKKLVLSVKETTAIRKTEERLKRIKWMVTPDSVQAAPAGQNALPEYGDLSALNTRRVIMDAVGQELLADIAKDFLGLLNTSAAIYESNGDYALGIFSSRWCRFMDTASRRRCNTQNDREALSSGKWLCHESCRGASELCMVRGEPVDIACTGGIRLYAAPIYSDGKIIGTINMGYGDPPRDAATLQKLAGVYGVKVAELLEHAEAYESRPVFIIEMAKQRLLSAARLIGEIVARKNTEKALRESQQRFRTVLENLSGAIFAHDLDGRFLFVNESACRNTGYSREELLRMQVKDIDPASGGSDGCMQAWRSLAIGESMTFESTMIRKDGSAYDAEIHLNKINLDEKPVLLPIVFDISERRKARQQLQESEEKYRILIENLNEVIYALDENGRIVFISQTIESLTGYAPAELAGKKYTDFVHSDDKKRLLENFHASSLGIDAPVEYRLLTKDKRIVWVRTAARPLMKKGQVAGVQGVLSDITRQKQAEESLRQSEQRYRSIISLSNTGAWEYHGDIDFLWCSPEYLTMLGYRPDDFETNGDIKDFWIALLHPADREQAPQYFAQYLANGSVGMYEQYFRMRHKNGEWVWIWSRGQTLRNPDETASNITLGIHINITEIKQAEAEREKLQAQLNQAQKLESIGRLAGGVAHDFNNMLTIINGYAEMMAESLPSSDPMHDDVLQIQDAGKRSSVIVRKLLAFARKQAISPVPMNLNDSVSGMLKMLERLIGENIDLLWKPGPDIWQVKMDLSQIDQILANLVVNARDAVADFGKITIGTQNIEFDDEYCEHRTGFVPGQYVMLAVSDNGCGMNQEILDNLFEPFFTTKGIGEGTGLGLPTVYGIVKQNEGFINVYSEPGQGTTFRIYLPRNGNDAVGRTSENKQAYPPGNGETILVLEDEIPVLNLTKSMLEKQGYEVLASDSPHDALALVNTHGGKIDLIITDVVMPEMNGRDFVEHIKSHYPEIKAVFMSGYTADAIAHHGILDGGIHFIQKPFSFTALAEKVREAIGQDAEMQ